MSLADRYERAWDRAAELGAVAELVELVERAVSSLEHAARDYDAMRWGKAPDGVCVAGVPIIRPGQTLTELGTLEAVHYGGIKGSDDAVWEHAFGEHGEEKPRLCFTPAAKRASDRRLVIVGGDYKVTEAGIVG